MALFSPSLLIFTVASAGSQSALTNEGMSPSTSNLVIYHLCFNRGWEWPNGWFKLAHRVGKAVALVIATGQRWVRTREFVLEETPGVVRRPG